MSAVDTLLALGRRLNVGKNINGNIYVEYEGAWVKDGIALKGEAGTGNTFDEACRDYIEIIQGKTLVFNPSSSTREEVKVLFVEGDNAT